MSTATRVPETWELTGDDARETLLETGRMRLVADAFARLRYADGFSHARSLAFAMSLVFVQGLIALVGFAAAFGNLEVSRVIVDTIQNAMPGLAGDLLTDAVQQARDVGAKNRFLPLTLGLIGTLVTATTALGQIERAVNRIYGIERDRPALEKYGRAFLLALSVGFLFAVAFVLLAFGRDIGREDDLVHSIWMIVRWPAGLLLAGLALTGLLQYAPRRHQPNMSWLAFGAGIGVALWTAVTLDLRGRLQRELLVRRDLRARSRASSRSSSGRSSPRSRSSSASPSPRSWRPCARAVREPATPDPEEHPGATGRGAAGCRSSAVVDA